jgi:quinol monooxygenase YgiN
MFIARIVLTIQDPQRDAFRQYAAGEGLGPRALAGCVDYSFCEDVAEPKRVLLYEEWATREAFESYKASPSFAAASARLQPMLAEPPRSAYYDSEDLFGGACAVR